MSNRPEASPSDGVWERYRANAARHLIGVARDLQSRVMLRLRDEEGYDGLRPSLGPFLSHVSIAPKPISELADRLAITKQACSQIAKVAERSGFILREADPTRLRTRQIRLAARGQALVDASVRLIFAAEADYAGIVGLAAFAEFQAAASELFSALDILADADAELRVAARQSIAILPLIAVRIEQDLMAATAARGHEGLKMSHGQVLPLIGPEGGRIGEIARIHRVSKQAISATCQDLEELGYLSRETDPKDRRGIVMQLTERGEELIRDSVHAADALEEEFAKVLGRDRLNGMCAVASELYQSLHLEEEVFGRGEVRTYATAPAAADSRRSPTDDVDLAALADELALELGEERVAQLGVLLQDR